MIEEGLIIINKPCGHVSHDITVFVKKLLGANRTGHAGTLDPDVSGVMPIAVNRATKLLGYLSGKRKRYISIIKFKDKDISDSEIKQLFREFTGTLVQTPPKISAVRKIPRKRTVYSLKFLERKGNLVLFDTEVDAGTYIRTLCEDIGKKCNGARMEELRRTEVGDIKENEAVSLQDLIDAVWLYKHGKKEMLLGMIKKPEDYINAKKVFVNEKAKQAISHGAQLMAPGISKAEEGIRKDETVALYSESGKFIGMGKALFDKEAMLKMKKGIAVKIERVHA
jgi:H/ACA ribonucleoprotein complex subunit 4